MQAYQANYVTREGKLVIDDPEIRRRLIRTMDSYTAIYRKGCTPPDAVDWDDAGNNQAFLAQTVVDDRERDALDPERAQGGAPRGLLQERRHDRVADWRRRPDPRHQNQLLRGHSLQGRRACSSGQGVRALPRGRGLARALSRLLRRAPPAADAEAARPAVLARPERPAPHGCGDAVPGPARTSTTMRWPPAIGGTSWWSGRRSGRRPSTASPPTASAPSRRSTRRSPGSSRS